MEIKDNEIENNYAGLQRSIVHIEGFPKVVFSDNIIKENENYLPNTFRDESGIYAQQTD